MAEVQQKRIEESEERTQELEAALASEKEAGEAAEKRAVEAEHRADLAEQAAGYEKSRADSAEAKVQEFNSLGFWQRLFWKG
jgi:hypothetical protein